jgi:probable biosynthetic protein (TIGR04098 family)
MIASPSLRRDYSINMPQMALGGLSESWLFKELGDIHWAMIAGGLNSQTSLLADANGDRLYPTFTRVRIAATAPISTVPENTHGTANGHIRRFGNGVFFGEVRLSLGTNTIDVQLMSSFTKRSQAGSNASLLKGQPPVPENCAIPNLEALPAFAEEYRERRRGPFAKPLFTCEYKIIPFHDINGVGLLYFAAYPVINDICELNYMDRGLDWALDSSTLTRDILYFANSDLNDRIVYRVHSQYVQGRTIRIESSLSRASDDAMMAYLVTEKALLPDLRAST